jgi:hypothetical protein
MPRSEAVHGARGLPLETGVSRSIWHGRGTSLGRKVSAPPCCCTSCGTELTLTAILLRHYAMQLPGSKSAGTLPYSPGCHFPEPNNCFA